MFSFFKKKPALPDAAEPADSPPAAASAATEEPAPEEQPERRSWLDRLRGLAGDLTTGNDALPEPQWPPLPAGTEAPDEPVQESLPLETPAAKPEPGSRPTIALPPVDALERPFVDPDFVAPADALAEDSPAERRNWFDKLRGGLRRTGSSLAQVFIGTKIDDALYEELEDALLLADAGVRATEFLLDDLKRRVKETKASDPSAVKALLADAVADLLRPLQRPLVVGEQVPTVIMVVGVNGAGKTTTIGKLTRHLAAADRKVLLAAADTFRAAAREQLAVWAGRNRVEIVSQEGGDPAAVTFDSVVAGKARGCDVVIADTAGRLTTQVHLMDELKKIRRVIGKAQAGAPHEVLLVVDGNTGQNALSQVQLFDAALGLTGLVITKLDGTAKGGVLAAIALWSRDREEESGGAFAPLPVYFIGVGEKLEDLQTFDAREFAQALLG